MCIRTYKAVPNEAIRLLGLVRRNYNRMAKNHNMINILIPKLLECLLHIYLMNNKRHVHCCRTHSWFLEVENEGE